MVDRRDTRQLVSSSDRWSLSLYDDEKPLHRCPVQQRVYEPSVVSRSLQLGKHDRRIVNEFSPLYSNFFCKNIHTQ